MSEDLGNFESLEQKEKIAKYLVDMLNEESGLSGTLFEYKASELQLEALTKEEIKNLLDMASKGKKPSVKMMEKPSISSDSIAPPAPAKPPKKIWILHSNGFSLVNYVDVKNTLEETFLKQAKLPPIESIHPSEHQRYKAEVERLKKLASEWICREFLFNYEVNTSEVNCLTKIGKYSWQQCPSEDKEVCVQSSKDFTEECKERNPIKIWETLKFSTSGAFAINPKAFEYLFFDQLGKEEE